MKRDVVVRDVAKPDVEPGEDVGRAGAVGDTGAVGADVGMTVGLSAGSGLTAERRIARLLPVLERSRRVQEHRMRLGTADLRIQWLLSDGRARTLREIATELRLEQSTVNRQINAALAQDLVERGPRDGSAAHVYSPTAHGVEAFSADVSISLTALATGLEALGDGVEEFLDTFERFVDAYDATVQNGDHLGLPYCVNSRADDGAAPSAR